MSHGRKEASGLVNQDDQIIKIRSFDYLYLVVKYKFSLVGRRFHLDERSLEALIGFMQKRQIWDVEGRVKGTDLGNGKFQLYFDKEEDMLKVLSKRPCHYNRWSFALEKWEATIREDFPNTMLFWIQVLGIPTHYKKDETYRDIRGALGDVKDVDVAGGRVQVSLNGDNPLQFKRKASFDNGDVITVRLKYEELLRYCFTCFRISHDESTCPELSEPDRDSKRRVRSDLAASRGMSPRLVSPSLVQQQFEERRSNRSDRDLSAKRHLEDSFSPKRAENRRGDLRDEIQSKRDSRNKEVWKRIDTKYRGNHRSSPYRYRERFHPYDRNHRGHMQYEKPDPRYESSTTSSSRLPMYSGEGEVNSRKNALWAKKSYGWRRETLAVSDSQRTILDYRRVERNLSDLRSKCHVDYGGKSYREKSDPKERKGKGVAYKSDFHETLKPQWKRKEIHQMPSREPPLPEPPSEHLSRGHKELDSQSKINSGTLLKD